jgi:hypothetical protein
MAGGRKPWLAVEEDKPVKFSDLAHMMALALQPEGGIAYGAARAQLDDELPRAVQHGELRVRNALTLGEHTFPMGDALNRAVVLPFDLRDFLATRGIELRLIPHGSGPKFWTLENAAAAIAKQERWHGEAQGSLLDALMDAARRGELTVREPHTDLPTRTPDVRQFYELVAPDDVNRWLDEVKAGYRWNEAGEEQDKFMPLTVTLEPYFEQPMAGLPKVIAALVSGAYRLFSWDALSPDQRRSLAQQKDAQEDPALAPLREWAFRQVTRDHELQQEIESLKRAAAPTVLDIAKKKEMLAALEAELRELREATFPGAEAEMTPDVPPRQKAQVQQEDFILSTIVALGHDPKALPPQPPGKPGVKAQVRALALKNKRLFQSAEVFKKAWERLRGRREIAGGEVSGR